MPATISTVTSMGYIGGDMSLVTMMGFGFGEASTGIVIHLIDGQDITVVPTALAGGVDHLIMTGHSLAVRSGGRVGGTRTGRRVL